MDSLQGMQLLRYLGKEGCRGLRDGSFGGLRELPLTCLKARECRGVVDPGSENLQGMPLAELWVGGEEEQIPGSQVCFPSHKDQPSLPCLC